MVAPIPEKRGRHLLREEQWVHVQSHFSLSDRELQLVQSVFDLQTEDGIAEQLGISDNTVHTYFGRLYRKLSVSTRAGVVIRVFESVME